MVTAIKDKKLRTTYIAQKISRFQSSPPYSSSEYCNLRHTIPLTGLNNDHGIKTLQESLLSFFI